MWTVLMWRTTSSSSCLCEPMPFQLPALFSLPNDGDAAGRGGWEEQRRCADGEAAARHHPLCGAAEGADLEAPQGAQNLLGEPSPLEATTGRNERHLHDDDDNDNDDDDFNNDDKDDGDGNRCREVVVDHSAPRRSAAIFVESRHLLERSPRYRLRKQHLLLLHRAGLRPSGIRQGALTDMAVETKTVATTGIVPTGHFFFFLK